MSLLIVENAFTTLRTLLITRSRILFKLNFALNFILSSFPVFRVFSFGLNLVPVKLLLRTFRAQMLVCMKAFAQCITALVLLSERNLRSEKNF